MLNGGTSHGSPPADDLLHKEPLTRSLPEVAVPPPQRQEIQPRRPSALRSPASASQWTRFRLLYLGAAALLVCSLAGFVLFTRRDRAIDIKLKPLESSAAVAASKETPAARLPVADQPVAAPAASPVTEAPQQKTAAPEPVSFKLRQSKIYERVGSIRIRLNRTNPKRSTCDLYIAAGGPAYQKQARLNKPVQIDLPQGNGSLELVVTSINSGGISGSVQQTP